MNRAEFDLLIQTALTVIKTCDEGDKRTIERCINALEPEPVYETPRDPAETIRVRGVGRTADEPRALLVLLTERPTDDELRSMHEYLRNWDPSSKPIIMEHGPNCGCHYCT